MDKNITASSIDLVQSGAFKTIFDLNKFLNENGIEKRDNIVPLIPLIKALRFKLTNPSSVGEGSYDYDTTDVNELKKREEIRKLKIYNNLQLKKLIPIESARDRIRTLVTEVKQSIFYAIKSSAGKVAHSTDPVECEKILTSEYNMAIEILKDKAIMKEWEDESASGSTRI